jgi:tRNA pseudouridine13 synthase
MDASQWNARDMLTLAPYLTSKLPGIGGVLKREPEDFVVEEIPAYQPCGGGEHLFLWVEKRDVSAEDLVTHLARSLGIRREGVGVAGLKDRRAVTRQFVSVPAAREPQLDSIETSGIRVLHATRHRNKLRTGQLRGNRFDVLVRDVSPDAWANAEAIAGVIRERGFPNYYGEQRFGIGGATAQLGLDLLAGRKTPRDIEPRRRKFLLRLSLSAAQSAVFNVVLRERLADGLLGTVLAGDVMQVTASGGCFVVEDVPREQQRYDQRETVLTGLLFGPKMKTPTNEPAEREQRVLDRFGITPQQVVEFPRLLTGARRPLVIRVDDLQIAPDPAGLRFRFTLPSGVYATTLLREFMKNDAAPENEITSEPD